jgi:hypothetical protein
MNKFKLKITSFIFSLKSTEALALNFDKCVYLYQISLQEIIHKFLKTKTKLFELNSKFKFKSKPKAKQCYKIIQNLL